MSRFTDEQIVAEVRRRHAEDPLPCGKTHIAMMAARFSCAWARFKPLYAQAVETQPELKIAEQPASGGNGPAQKRAGKAATPWRPTEVQRAVLSLLQQGLSLHCIKNGAQDIVWVAPDPARFPRLQDRMKVTSATLDSLVQRKLVRVTHRWKDPDGAAYGLSEEGAVLAARHPGNLDAYRSERQVEEVRAKEATARKAAKKAASAG